MAAAGNIDHMERTSSLLLLTHLARLWLRAQQIFLTLLIADTLEMRNLLIYLLCQVA
jgi:hypothetical protein